MVNQFLIKEEAVHQPPLKIVIFGVSFYGRATYRTLRRNPSKYKIVAFLDNSPDIQGTKFGDVPVYAPEAIKSLDYDYIALAGRHINEMRDQLVNDYDITEKLVWVLRRSEIKPTNEELARRSGELDCMLEDLVSLFDNYNIRYWIEASGLLALMRDQDLAELSDVDIDVPSTEIEFLYRKLQSLSNNNYSVSCTRHQASSSLWATDEIAQIVMKSSTDSVKYEPATIDISSLYMNDGENVNICCENRKCKRVPNRFFKTYKSVNYKGWLLRVPAFPKEYLELLYGDWRTPTEILTSHNMSLYVRI